MPSFRERLLQDIEAKRLARLEKVRESIALQEAGEGGLFPEEERLRRDYLALQERQLAQLAEQRQRLRSLASSVPRAKLNPTRNRGEEELWRKSGIPRWAAILGLLEREREKNVPLTRAMWMRAQASAARSRKLDLRQAYRRSGTPLSSDASFKGEASFFDLHGVDIDPCIEILARQSRRRQVIFARGLNRGYRSRKQRRIC